MSAGFVYFSEQKSYHWIHNENGSLIKPVQITFNSPIVSSMPRKIIKDKYWS